jgi:hypothetical protein
MLSFCGQRFEVSSVAHKTCETAKRTYVGRRLDETVHLAALRCDGSAHGGCQADCKLFWKDAWLRRVDEKEPRVTAPSSKAAVTERVLNEKTQLPILSETGAVRYSCQATKVYDASRPLSWSNVLQYWRDISTGNHSVLKSARVFWFAMWRSMLHNLPFGYRALHFMRGRMHRWMLGFDVPDVGGAIPDGQATPTLVLGLQPGELVRIKSKEEIVQTIRKDRKNRGMRFDQEMVPYCGKTAAVRINVKRIIDEDTGEMLQMKAPTIILEGVYCQAEYSECRLLCPRGVPLFWRELWLERVNAEAPPADAASTDALAVQPSSARR